MHELFRIDVFINGAWKAQDSNQFNPNPSHDRIKQLGRAQLTAQECPTTPVRVMQGTVPVFAVQ